MQILPINFCGEQIDEDDHLNYNLVNSLKNKSFERKAVRLDSEIFQILRKSISVLYCFFVLDCS